MTKQVHATIGTIDEMFNDAIVSAQDLDKGITKPTGAAIYFDTTQDMLRVLSTKRTELLQALNQVGAMNVLTLAKHLGRDYKNVHGDVQLLERYGLIERDGDRVTAPYDMIHADFDLRKAA